MTSSGSRPGGEVVVYQAPDGEVRVDVRLDRDTVWLSLNQMADLFDRDKSVISRHLRNVFGSRELERTATVARNATVQREAGREVVREIDYFNLDAILSVGYRVNSKRGTQFRIWATRTLREHLVRGYTLNQRRLAERGLGDIEQAVALMARTLKTHALVTEEGRAVLDVVRQYTRAWRLLLEFDEERLAEGPARPLPPRVPIALDEVRAAVAALRDELLKRKEAGTLFGQEMGEGLARIVGAIEQSFDGAPLYPSAQTRAAHILYFVIKDHPFGDGNKRIGSLLFLDYLRRHEILLRRDGTLRLADNAMVALALLIAESEPRQKELMTRLVLNLLGDEVS
ncbi:MAG: virulence protein RhuM/Fic/DOC family protein [Acidobacteria bacterium]|nr:virulence protein RhuM/Fic/DOC family protein [Acidobacteriota bacterium]